MFLCLQVFEVDQALVLAFKRKIISGPTARSVIPDKKLGGIGVACVVGVEADLGKTSWESELIEAGFDPTLPSAWVVEGLTM